MKCFDLDREAKLIRNQLDLVLEVLRRLKRLAKVLKCSRVQILNLNEL